MIKTIYVTGYKSFELNIFKDDAPEVSYLKKFIAHKLKSLIEEGLECVLIQGQMGIELWTAEVVINLKETYPDLILCVVTVFYSHIDRCNEQNQAKYNHIIQYADFVDSVFHTSYVYPHQFKQTYQFMLDHANQTLQIYDE